MQERGYNMKRKIAVLISLLIFVIASTAQASDVDPRMSPLTSPLIIEVPAIRVFKPQKSKAIRITVSPSWWAWYSEGKR